jgi:DNA replication protein DnaC
MLTNPTIDGLTALRLPGMVRGLLEQREHPDYGSLGFEERLGMLVDRELAERHNRKLQRMLKVAHLRLSASIEGIDFARPRGLQRAQVLSLAESHWVSAHHSVVIVGATGLGKTYIGCALANAAIRRGYSALYLRGPRLHDEIALARADGRLPRLMAAWARTDVLLVDDFLLRPLASDQAADVLEVIEDRVGLRSTIVTSQLPVAMWHEALGEPTVADGILDRLLEFEHRIELRGESMRRAKRAKPNADADNTNGRSELDPATAPPADQAPQAPPQRRARSPKPAQT